jgi:3-oxoacyl-[acyl-carrier-protein] synthase II
LAVGRAKLFASADPFERPFTGALTRAFVTSIGHWRGEGIGLVESLRTGGGE